MDRPFNQLAHGCRPYLRFIGGIVFLLSHAHAHTWYVSTNGNNTSGTNWGQAWNELDQIDWPTIQPGDRILLDGGPTGSRMIYYTTLEVMRDGASNAAIQIERSTEPGRNGQVVIHGRRLNPLPYPGQTTYQADYANDTPKNRAGYNALYQQYHHINCSDERGRSAGLVLRGRRHIIVDGKSWNGLRIEGHFGEGILLDRAYVNCWSGPDQNNNAHITLRNIELYNNGGYEVSGVASYDADSDLTVPAGTYRSRNRPAIALSGDHITIERVSAYNNGQDVIQSIGGGSINHLTIRHSYFYYTDEFLFPGRPGKVGANYWHNDVLQIYSGTNQSGLHMDRVIIGPGYAHALIANVPLDDVTLTDVVFYTGQLRTKGNSVYASSSASKNWTLTHVTFHVPDGHYIGSSGSNHWPGEPSTWHYYWSNPGLSEISNATVTHSIFRGGALSIHADSIFRSNCFYLTRGAAAAGTPSHYGDPSFASVDPTAFLDTGYDFTPTNPACTNCGSRLTRVAQLLDLVHSLNGDKARAFNLEATTGGATGRRSDRY